jgi:hypothetical protein
MNGETIAMKGIVTNEGSKQVNTRFGVKTTYSIEVDGVWFKCGFKKPPCKPGDEIEFDDSVGTYGAEAKNVRPVGSRVQGVEETPVKTPTKATNYGRPEKTFPVPLLHGDRSIIRQNSLAHATNLVVSVYPKESVLVPAQTELDSMAEMVIKVAMKFEEYSAGDLERHELEKLEQKVKA